MVPHSVARVKVIVGSLVLAAIPATLAILLASPGVRAPLGRVLLVMGRDFLPATDDDPAFSVAEARGIIEGQPVFVVDAEGRGRPIAHVLSVTSAEGAGEIRIRFEPGEGGGAPWRLTAYPPSTNLGEALAMAVPEETATRLGQELSDRVETTLREALLPEAEKRIPGFLRRIDPTTDPAAKEVMDLVGAAVLSRIEPLLGSLTDEVTKAMDDKFDFLDRVGLLWKMLRGDAKGLKRELEPVAKDAARRWWTAHQKDVLAAVGQGLKEGGPALTTWFKGTAWTAAKEDVLLPVLEAQKDRLKEEGGALLRRVVEEVVLSPSGTFRVRFAEVLRTHLFGKKVALLLLTHDGAGP